MESLADPKFQAWAKLPINLYWKKLIAIQYFLWMVAINQKKPIFSHNPIQIPVEPQ